MSRILSASNNELINESNYTSIKSAATSGDSTLTVYSISKFAVNQILLIGEFGQEGSEIIATSSSSAPSGTTVTLTTTLTKSHPADTKVYIIPFNQVEFSHATTATGDKSVLSTESIDAEKEETTYSDTNSSGYYFIRWYNSVTTLFSDYSDALPYSGHETNTVGYIVNLAMDQTGKSFTEKLTYENLVDEINSCLRYIRGKLKRWSDVQNFNYELDDALVEDDYTWTLPSDYYDPNSNRSMRQIWLEDQDNLRYVDKEEFDDLDRDADSGTPKFYTVYDGSVYITPKVHSDYAGDSIYMDYYTDIVEVDSDSDEITLARHDMVKHWLKWQIRNITERNGNPDYQDGDWVMFNSILNDAIRRESSGQKYKMKPQLNGIFYPGQQDGRLPFEQS